MNVKEIKEILQLMAEHSLTEIEVEKDGMKIKLRKASSGRMISEEMRESAPPVVTYASPARSSENRPSAVMEAPKPVADASMAIAKSPMVGTYYASPAPDQPAYVSVGKKIKEGDVLCIVEAMKLMNEIKAEISGNIAEILVKNGQPVEFDQPLFKIQKG